MKTLKSSPAPDLSEIAAFNDMRYLEESILLPGAQIVSGYGAVTVRAKGTTFQGTLVSQDEEKNCRPNQNGRRRGRRAHHLIERT